MSIDHRGRPIVRETDLREQIRYLAKLYGWIFYFTKDSRFSPKGFPDVVLVKGPRLAFRELKRDAGPRGGTSGVRTSPEQEAWGNALTYVGRCVGERDAAEITYGVWRPSDLPKIIAFMSRTP